MNQDIDNIADLIRQTHCSRREADHKCVGECTFTATGRIKLNCPVCGEDDLDPLRRERDPTWAKICKAIVIEVGMDWDKLEARVQVAAIKKAANLLGCPNCHRSVVDDTNWYECECGWIKATEYTGATRWRKPLPKEKP